MITPNALVAIDHGTHYDLTPTGVLLMLADSATDQETSPNGKRNAHKMLEDMLQAAIDGGYAQADILQTLLLQRPMDTPRVTEMVQAACMAAGNERIAAVWAESRLKRS